MLWIELIITGFIIGTLVISMGGGGAAIYLGVLTGVFHLPAAVAAATSLFTAFPSLCVGAYSHYRTGNVEAKVGNRMLLAALPATIVGSLLSPFIPTKIYTWVIAIILVLLGVQIIARQYLPHRNKTAKGGTKRIQAIAFGILSGLMVGVAGLSGGGPILAGLLLMGLDTVHAAATSSYVLVGTTLIGLLFHMSSGHVDWSIGFGLMIGAIIGAALAPIIINRLNTRVLNLVLQPMMGLLLVVMGLRMIL